MKTKLLFLTFLLPTIMLAQTAANFENVPGVTFNAVGNACVYFDSDATTVHTITNYTAPCGIIYVTETGTPTTLGYSIVLDPTTPNGPNGFSDGDFFGVGTTSAFTTEFGVAPPEGNQAFLMEDVDGTITMSFDLVDLAGTTNPQFSMQYILEGTSWEADDFLKITIEFSDCGSSTVTLIDTTGQDIDNLGIEDSWNTLSADLSGSVGCKAQLIVEFSSNSAAEELGLDAVSFSAGMTLSTASFDLNDSIVVYPNPSNGVITIKNSGVALNKAVITDVNGRTIAGYDLNGTTQDKSFDLRSLVSSGLYFMTISSENGSSTVKKIIIE